jgi:hypothetical protein
MKDVQAGGVIGGRIESSFPDTPALMSFDRFGIPPSAIHGRIIVQVAASKPMTTAFGTFFM